MQELLASIEAKLSFNTELLILFKRIAKSNRLMRPNSHFEFTEMEKKFRLDFMSTVKRRFETEIELYRRSLEDITGLCNLKSRNEFDTMCPDASKELESLEIAAMFIEVIYRDLKRREPTACLLKEKPTVQTIHPKRRRGDMEQGMRLAH